ncbi:MAG TPA: hypothetical protein VH816_17105 [Gaiellaceae bacterium]|jgi:hypothetical protein
MHTKHALLVAAAALSLAVLAGPSLGAGQANAPIRVTGTQTEVDPAKGQYLMHGSLVGPWQITSFKPVYASSTQFAATGTEVFSGCLDSNRNGTCDTGEPNGTLRFAAKFWGELDPATKEETRGGCFHAVSGGTGDFAKAKGVLSMTDTPAPAGLKTTYRGELLLAGAVPPTQMRTTQGVHRQAASPGC